MNPKNNRGAGFAVEGMSKQDDKFRKIQTSVLKVSIHCDACRRKVNKILQKIEGVYTITIDEQHGKVTVTGNVDAATLIKKLKKAGKRAELLLAPKFCNNDTNIFKFNPFNKQQPEDARLQQQNKMRTQNGQQHALPQHQHPMKGFKDLKLTHNYSKVPLKKDPKSVKFTLPANTKSCGDWSDSGDDSYDGDEDMDFFDVDLKDNFRSMKNKPRNLLPTGNRMTPVDKKGIKGDVDRGTNSKKGGSGMEFQTQIKGKDVPLKYYNGVAGNVAGGTSGGNTIAGVAPIQNESAYFGGWNTRGGGPVDTKNFGAVIGGGKNDLGIMQPMKNPNMTGEGFHQTGNTQAPRNQVPSDNQVHRGGGTPAGYFLQGMRPQNEEIAAAAANPYEHQYIAAMLQQQQQQQQRMMMMMMNGQCGAVNPVMWACQHPPVAVECAAQVPAQGEPYTNLFSDENTSGCSIM